VDLLDGGFKKLEEVSLGDVSLNLGFSHVDGSVFSQDFKDFVFEDGHLVEAVIIGILEVSLDSNGWGWSRIVE